MALPVKTGPKTQLPTLTTTPRSASQRDLASWFEHRPWLDNETSFSGLVESNPCSGSRRDTGRTTHVRPRRPSRRGAFGRIST